MGKSQKTKGRAQEYVLRDYLRQQGWEADRVVCSGAIKGLPGDVKATKAGKTLLFEMKSRKASFTKIYELYDKHIRSQGDDVMALALPGEPLLCCRLSSSLDGVLGGVEYHTIVTEHPLYKDYKRTFSKIANLQKLVKGSDVLAIKDDRRPLVFLRFF